MTKELLLAAFLVGVGLCVSGMGTHLYQWLTREQAMLRYDGKTFAGSLGNLAISFVCGPYIMLQMGWRHEDDGTTTLRGAVTDQAELHGLLAKVRDLGATLISVTPQEADPQTVRTPDLARDQKPRSRRLRHRG